MDQEFDIVGTINEIVIIAIGNQIRELHELRARFGYGRGRKLKGVASVRLPDGTIRVPRYIGIRPTALARLE